ALVKAAFRPGHRLPPEMLDDVRDEGLLAAHAGFSERLVEHLSGGTNERLARPILLVPGLLPDEHDPGRDGSDSEDRLRRALPQVAGPARIRRAPDELDVCAGSRGCRCSGRPRFRSDVEQVQLRDPGRCHRRFTVPSAMAASPWAGSTVFGKRRTLARALPTASAIDSA